MSFVDDAMKQRVKMYFSAKLVYLRYAEANYLRRFWTLITHNILITDNQCDF